MKLALAGLMIAAAPFIGAFAIDTTIGHAVANTSLVAQR